MRPSGLSSAGVSTVVPATCPEVEAITHWVDRLRSVRWCAEWSAASNANRERIRTRASVVTRRTRRLRAARRRMARRREDQERAKAPDAVRGVQAAGSMIVDSSPVAGTPELKLVWANAGPAMPRRTRAVKGERSWVVTVAFPEIERSSSREERPLHQRHASP
jgi:hypothetical protein